MRTLKQVAVDMANAFTRYGLWKGGGSGGSSALADMTDVSFSNLKENDLLKYNGSVWVNSDNIHEYSTEEKVVGKWVDGKDIFERVIVLERFVVNANSWYTTNIIFNFEKTLKCYLITDDGIGYPAIASQNNGKLTVRHFRNDDLAFNTIIVQYIKQNIRGA